MSDDQPIGRVLSRREALVVLSVAGAAALAACATREREATPAGSATSSREAAATPGATPAETVGTAAEGTPTPGGAGAQAMCVVRPEQTLGPYFVDEVLNRSDVRPDPAGGPASEGAELKLTLRVSQIDGAGCAALPGAQVDIWQCDANGVYSGVQGNTAQFLRGYQISDADGVAQFTTIYPGWYPGRTVHIHFMIRTAPEAPVHYEFVAQLYFDDALTDEVHQQEPYAAHGARNTRNASDGIYRQGGDQLLLDVVPAEAGYAATFDIALQVG